MTLAGTGPDGAGQHAHAPEFSRIIRLVRLGPEEREEEVCASQAECTALGARLGLPAVLALSCRYRLKLEAGGGFAVVRAQGMLQARVVQICVVSLEPFEAELVVPFVVRFVPAGRETDEIDPESEDEIPYQAGSIDLGEAAVEELALALDPYPRGPDASLESPASPFSA